MDQTTNQLADVLSMELELARALLDLHKEQQRAITSYDGKGLLASVEREHEILVPLGALERERVRLFAESAARQENIRQNNRIDMLSKDLKDVGTQIVSVNKLNRMLLEHSKEFLQENLRMMTGNYSLQLVDRRG